MKAFHILAALWLAAFASPALAKLDAEHYALPNGMKVVVVERPGTDVITHMIWFDVGSTYEPQGKSGIAHYLEHLVFKETEELGVNEYSRRIEAMGGNNNAFTGRDFTAYYVSIGAQNLEAVMDLEAERLMRLNPSQESFDSEKGVILEERAMRIDNQPVQQLQEAMMSALFKHHQYRIPIIGWEHEIKALTLKDAMDFYHYYYQPKNATMLVVGDVKAEDVYRLAKKHFGSWRARPEAKPLILEEPPRKADILLTLHHPGVKQPQWIYMYTAPSLGVGNQKDIFPLMVLSELLGSGKTSLLYKEMAVKNKIAIDTGSDYDDFMRGPGTFTVYATPVEGAAREEFYAGYLRILNEVAEKGVPAQELERIKNKLKASSIYARDGNTAIAYLLGQLLVLGKDESYFNAWEDSIDAVSADDIRSAAELLLKSEPPVAGVLLPEVK